MKLRLETEILRKLKDKRIQELEESLNKLRATLENKINLQQTTISSTEVYSASRWLDPPQELRTL
jgi:hypothetical protein